MELLLLGHTITASGIKFNPAKAQAISKMPPLKYVGEVKILLNMVAYVHRFIAGCGELIDHLTKILNLK